MDAQAAVERLLETANLTDDLDDEAADQLIAWGANSLRTLITPMDDDKTGGDKLNKVMALMRAVRQIAKNAQGGEAQDLQHYIQLFLNNATEVFPIQAVQRGNEVVKLMANGVVGKAPTQAIQQLLSAVMPSTPAQPPTEGITEETDTESSFDENDDPVM